MTALQISILHRDLAAQTAEIRSLRALITEVLPKLSDEVVGVKNTVKAMVDELPCRMRRRSHR
jgi:hypothetical protein